MRNKDLRHLGSGSFDFTGLWRDSLNRFILIEKRSKYGWIGFLLDSFKGKVKQYNYDDYGRCVLDDTLLMIKERKGKNG